MVNLFLVKSPLQLLNAIEANQYFSADINILILRFTSNARTNDQMKNLLEIKRWDTVYNIPYSRIPINFIKEFFLLKKLLKSGLRFNDVFIGDYRLLNFQIFPINLKKSRTFLLDDGTSTFSVQDFYLKNQTEYAGKPFLEKIKKIIAASFFGFNTKMGEKIHLFTCYNITPHPGQLILRNEYVFTKTRLLHGRMIRQPNEGIYFIGAKYVEVKLIKEISYLDLMRKIKKHFIGKKLKYIPHRGESNAKLKRIAELGYDLEFFKNIVEIEFLFRKELPEIICGFTSSVLVNIPKIYPEINVMVFKVNEELFIPSYRNTLRNLYHRFNETEGLRITVI